MNLENYFGLYINGKAFVNTRVITYTNIKILFDRTVCIGYEKHSFDIKTCKLVLRKKEDMTREEILIYNTLRTDNGTRGIWNINAIGLKENPYEAVAYLISIRVDVFNLIEQGIAIREKDIKIN